MQEMQIWSLGLEDPLEEETKIHSSILAWKIHRERSLVGMGSPRVWAYTYTQNYLIQMSHYFLTLSIFKSSPELMLLFGLYVII